MFRVEHGQDTGSGILVAPTREELEAAQHDFQISGPTLRETATAEAIFTPIRPHPGWALVVKYVRDIMGASLGMLILSPLFLLTALVIKVTSRGPVFFKQTRCGLDGRLFQCYKFRTMVVDAEDLKKDLGHLNEMKGPVFKIHNDPRLTFVGRFLRKLSLDELPQLWNVLKGEMSLVGPRPATPEEVAKYKPHQLRRLSTIPGITGLWQVSGRNSIPEFDRWVELDLEYIDNWSLLLDCKILLKTVPVVLLRRGAC